MARARARVRAYPARSVLPPPHRLSVVAAAAVARVAPTILVMTTDARALTQSSGLLWVDKYRPATLHALDTVHAALTPRLQRLADSPADLPHLLLYGPSGAGKRTRARALLRAIFGAGVERTKVEHRTFNLEQASSSSSARQVELTTVSSAHHIELNPSDAGYNDRLVVQAVIKEIAASRPLEVSSSSESAMTTTRLRAGNSASATPPPTTTTTTTTTTMAANFKVVLLHEVDQMSRDAQQALRRTMEKYSRTCRLILVADSATRVLDPLRSRCLGIRVPAPTHDEIVATLRHVARRERLDATRSNVPEAFLRRVAACSERNLRRALLAFEASKVAQFPFGEQQPVARADWRAVCADVGALILQEQSPSALLKVRGKLYELLTHCIPAEVVMREVLMHALLAKVDQAMAVDLCAWAAYYEHRLQTGGKAILHLEAFAAKVMMVYKAYMAENAAMMAAELF